MDPCAYAPRLGIDEGKLWTQRKARATLWAIAGTSEGQYDCTPILLSADEPSVPPKLHPHTPISVLSLSHPLAPPTPHKIPPYPQIQSQILGPGWSQLPTPHD